MKALLSARRSALRLALAILVMVGMAAAAFLSTASVAAVGHTGQALVLRSSLTGVGLPTALLAQVSGSTNSRFAYPRNYYQPRSMAGRRAHGIQSNATSSTVTINEGVQTYDVFAPPPGFQPGDGALTPENRTPVWTSDGRYIVFSSNRSINGGVAADGHFHIWSIAAGGDNPLDLSATPSLHQITTGSGDEFYPALSPATPPNANTQLAFVSTAGNGVQNLYSVPNFDAGTTQVNVNNLKSLTIRNTPGDPNDLNTHFGEVDRPTWSPAGDRLAFSAVDSDGPYANTVHHIWSLYINSGGATSGDTTVPPAKLTNGPADDTDPAWTPDASVDLIAFASTAANGFTAGSIGNPAVSSAPATPTPLRSIYAITPTSTAPQQITTAGEDDFGPAWHMSTAFVGYLTFARGATSGDNHGIYFLPSVYQSGSNTVAPETNASAIQINTDDLPMRGGSPGNLFNKIYPSWSPFTGIEAVVYSSNRSITYNDPATGNPVENAISVVPGTNGVGAGYVGLLVSRYDDLDPPTFLPYSTGENIHVTNGTDDTPRRNGDITPGNPVTFTVRLSNREAGIDDDNVYIQIKDPDSKYQDVQGFEHKVFTQDVNDSVTQANAGNPDSYPSSPVRGGHSVGSNTYYLYNGGAGGAYLAGVNSPLYSQLTAPTVTNQTARAYGNLFYPYFDVAEARQQFTVNNAPYYVQERGAVAGQDGGTAISVGRNAGGPSPITITTGSPAVTSRLGNGDPAGFQSFGQEYECQFVDANYNINGALNTVLTDYGTPFYLAGVDDQGAHSGGTHAAPTDTNGNLEWVQLARLPDAQQDGQGGVLYSNAVNPANPNVKPWVTPTSASDYYLDVIAYDKAVQPLTPATTAANWRIYDNIWGFSTQAFQGGKDILVVSDNTLGQKFVGSTFGGNGLEAIPPIFYGAESYYTDIDTNLLPNAIYRYVSESGSTPTYHTDFRQADDTTVPLNDTLPIPEVINLSLTGQPGLPFPGQIPVLNGLGVNSYNDELVSQQTSVVGGVAVPVSQQYSLWRILARGSVDPNVLNTYSPSPAQMQPAVSDPVTKYKAPAEVVPVNHRCVIWAAPYAGDLPLNSTNSIADGSTQDELRAFVLGGTYGGVTFSGGGRLFVSGASIASTLGSTTASNTTGSFITDVLSASSVGTATNTFTGGSQNLSGGASNLGNRVSGDAYFNPNSAIGIAQRFLTQYDATLGFVYAAPNSQALILGNNYIDFPPNGLPNLWRTDGSLDQLGPVPSTFGPAANRAQSQVGLITAQNGATVDTSFNITGPGFDNQTAGTGSGLVYNVDVGTNGGATGARAAFASFGLEGIGIEYYKETINTVDTFFARNQRPNILHNMVCFLRTATISGQITQGSSGGAPAANAIVYLLPNGGTIPGINADGTPARQTYSALTNSDGSYQIQGVEPGDYFIAAYKNGFNRVESPNGKNVEGDTTQTFNLNLTPVSPGNISGQVKDANGNGIGGASLTFTSVDGLTKVTGTSRADGTYTITGVPPTDYTSSVTAAGFVTSTTPDAPTADPFTVVSAQTTPNVNFTLAAIPGTVGGLVVDAFDNTTPVGGATIAVTTQAGQAVKDANGNPIVLTTSATATTSPADGVTGDGGLVNFTGSLPQGTYVLTLTPPANFNNPVPVSATVTVTTGAFTRVPTFTLNSTLGALSGTVTVAGGTNPVAGATVTVTQTDAGTSNTQTTTTAADGTYTFSALTQGDYKVVVSAATYLTQNSTFTITAHVTTTKNFQLVSTLATFGGLVSDSLTPTVPLAGATVTITDANGVAVTGSPLMTSGSATTSPADASGKTYQINYGPLTLPAVDASGTVLQYLVTVTKQGGGTTAKPDYNPSQTFMVTLTQGKFTVLNVPLVNATGTLGGLISDSLTPTVALAGATITVADPTGSVVATITSRNSTTSPGAPTGNGSPQNYSVSLYGGTGTTYTVTASATDHTVVSSKVVVTGSQFTPLSFSLVSTLGTVGGLVLDSSSGAPVAGATVTITDPTGAIVTTFTTSANQTAAPDGGTGQVNYSGTLKAGVTYGATVAKRGYGTSSGQSFTITPNTFTRIDFSGATYGLPPIHVFGAGYNFFSVPYDYASIGIGFDDLFGTLNTGTRAAPSAGSNRSHVFVWSPQLVQYVLDPQAPADGLHLGQGYWVYLLNSHEVTVAGTVPTAKSIPVTLHRGWNQIGVPSLTPIALSNLTFNNPATGGTISFADASGTYRLVSSPLYGYNGTSYVTMTAGSSLQPWQSYWIYAFADTTVNIPTS